MRIGFWVDGNRIVTESDFQSQPLGGTEHSILRLSQTLAARGHEVYLSGATETRAILDGRVVILPATSFLAIPYLDVVICTNGLHSIPNAKRVFLWSHIYQFDAPDPVSILDCGGIVYASESYRVLLTEKYPWLEESKWWQIPLGVDTAPKTRLKRYPWIAYAAIPNRGLSDLLAWVDDFVAAGIEKVMVYSGWELYYPYRKGLEDLAPLAEHPNVQVIGALPYQQLQRELSRCLIYCYPCNLSQEEPWCHSVQTAIACGLPVVTTTPRWPMSGRDRGQVWCGSIIRNDREVQDRMVAAVARLCEDKGYWTKLHNQGQEITQEHSWDKIAEQWESVLTR